ncbi:single-stranded-DNA-specific exonuclease RecJ [Paenibacillus gansuensis]|uniref:Single-stranded-DNA-specific exonuclease RecJ n=1 Tax=Paenibacillus gansuensis TaxID=306542 RepID=A0ABW5PCB0_9BACL
MLQAKARWNITEHDEAEIGRLSSDWGVHPLLMKLLLTRGIASSEEARLFLEGGAEHVHDPLLLRGMKEAVSRIRHALDTGEKIRIYGDYDADGVSSTSLMIHLFRGLNAEFDFYIPHRAKEGYGLNTAALDAAKEAGISLIITVDTGISAVEQIAHANSLGIDVIVTDHHEPPEVLPEAYALINPKLPGCPYPYKHLAGVGVAWKLAHALLGRFPEELLEIAVIGTIADLMPLTGENRVIAKLGLKKMRTTANPGIRALLTASGVSVEQVSAGNIAFAMAPRLNAAGRLDHASVSVRLLTTEDEQEAEELSYTLDAMNKERQRIVEEMTAEAMQQVEDEGLAADKVLVVAKEGWNVGVIGIVASKLLEKYYRPTIVLGIDPETGKCKGSARSIPGFDLYRALSSCSGLFDHYGGHQAAAGMTISREKLPQLREALNQEAEEQLTAEDLQPVMSADLACRLAEVTMESIGLMESLAPFGMANPSPRFVFEGLRIQEIRTMGKERQHVKLTLCDAAGGSVPIEAVAFNRPQLVHALSATSSLDVLGEISVNEWNGVRKPQILVQDLRVRHLQVFDWRGMPKPEEKLSELPAGGELTAVIAEPDAAEKLANRPMLEMLSIWAWTPEGKAVPVNDSARRVPISEAKNLVLYTLPGCLQSVVRILENGQAMERIYAVFSSQDGGSSGLTLPSRDDFKKVYAALKSKEQWNLRTGELQQFLRRRLGLSDSICGFILSVFEELSFTEKSDDYVRCAASPSKQELTSALAYRRRVDHIEAEQVLVYSSASELTAWFTGHLAPMQNTLLLEEIV